MRKENWISKRVMPTLVVVKGAVQNNLLTQQQLVVMKPLAALPASEALPREGIDPSRRLLSHCAGTDDRDSDNSNHSNNNNENTNKNTSKNNINSNNRNDNVYL